MKKLRIGMVGVGFIADWHLGGFAHHEEAEIVGLTRDFYGDDERRAQQAAGLEAKCRARGLKAYRSFAEMVADPSLDALILGSINPLHFPQAAAAIEHGKHLLVEKPVVTRVEEVAELEKRAAAAGVKIMPAHNFVYRNAVAKARAWIDEGKIGRVVHGSFVVTHTIGSGHAHGWRARKALGTGGTLMDSGHHLVYQSLYLLGRPTQIHGFTSTMLLRHMEAEDTAQVSLRYADGSIATIVQSWASNHGSRINGIRIFGTEGSIVIDDALHLNDEPVPAETDYAASFAGQAKAFSDYVLHDVAPLSPLAHVADTLRITYGAYRSQEAGTVEGLEH